MGRDCPLALWLLVDLLAATLFSMTSIGRKFRPVNSELASSHASFAPVEAGWKQAGQDRLGLPKFDLSCQHLVTKSKEACVELRGHPSVAGRFTTHKLSDRSVSWQLATHDFSCAINRRRCVGRRFHTCSSSHPGRTVGGYSRMLNAFKATRSQGEQPIKDQRVSGVLARTWTQ
jgi:hypothetical protein